MPTESPRSMLIPDSLLIVCARCCLPLEVPQLGPTSRLTAVSGLARFSHQPLSHWRRVAPSPSEATQRQLRGESEAIRGCRAATLGRTRVLEVGRGRSSCASNPSPASEPPHLSTQAAARSTRGSSPLTYPRQPRPLPAPYQPRPAIIYLHTWLQSPTRARKHVHVHVQVHVHTQPSAHTPKPEPSPNLTLSLALSLTLILT